ncbi:hypothetical protein [Usitatibacter rugosus]|uniref:hypothetical protein n=1 Tax=Usitatibacter rugosus TaxID=2732067 RepID=UPI00148898E4|nr:hypothetical protein [Usitatibacter rugosus]
MTIVARIATLTDDLEKGRTTLAAFASELLGHAEALEGVPYPQLKQVQLARAQILHAVGQKQDHLVDVPALVSWVRGWVRDVPVDAA